VFSKKGKAAERMLLQLERNPYPFKKEELLIYEGPNSYSEAYKMLTKDFYLAF
jgi:tRNA1Val (adenine37-N6)-methyltransferase